MERSPAQELLALAEAYTHSRLRRIAAAIHDTDRPQRFPLYAWFGITTKQAANYVCTVRKWESDAKTLRQKLQSIYARRAA